LKAGYSFLRNNFAIHFKKILWEKVIGALAAANYRLALTGKHAGEAAMLPQKIKRR
jgi:hypothetical protein